MFCSTISTPLCFSLSFFPTSLLAHCILPSAHGCIFLPTLVSSLSAHGSSVLPSSFSLSLSVSPQCLCSLPFLLHPIPLIPPFSGTCSFPSTSMYLNLPVPCFFLFPYLLDPPSQTLPFLLLFPESIIPHTLVLSLVSLFSPLTFPLFPPFCKFLSLSLSIYAYIYLYMYF